MKKLIQKLFLVLAGTGMAASFLMAPAATRAAGEIYTLSGTDITATGGAFAFSTTFAKQPDTTVGGTTYQAWLANASLSGGLSGCPIGIFESGGTYQINTKTSPGSPSCTQAQIESALGITDGSSISVSPAGSAGPTSASTAPASTSAAKTQLEDCDAGSFSWVICPIVSWAFSAIYYMENKVIRPFLEVPPLQANSGNPLYTVWVAIRAVTDGLFVIIFLVLIFGQTTSFGVDAYTIKRSLPRLVAAFIFVHFSFLICSLAIDATNILGAGIAGLMLAPIQNSGAAVSVVTATPLSSALAVTGIYAGVIAVAGAIASGAIFISLIAGFFAVLAVFVTLVFRQIIITILVVLSPLAFAAWVLPNTSVWFVAWRRNFLRLLMMYPLIIALFAGGKLVAVAASATGGGGAGNSEIASIISIVAAIAPLFLVPLTFKAAGGLLASGGEILGRVEGFGFRKTTESSSFQRMDEWSKRRQANMAAGAGVHFGKPGKGVTLGRGAGGRYIAQGAFSGAGTLYNGMMRKDTPSGQDLRSVAQFTKTRVAIGKELEEEGTTFAAYEVLANGRQWANIKIAKARRDGDQVTIDTYSQAIRDSETRGRIHNAAARSAAALWLSDKANYVTPSVRQGIVGGMMKDENGNMVRVTDNWAKEGSVAAKLIGKQTWDVAKQGVRKLNPTLTFTEVDGTHDVKGKFDFVYKQNQGTLAGYATDAFEKMRDDGTLALLAKTAGGRKTLGGLMGGGGQQANAAAQQVIAQVFNPRDPRKPNDPTDPAIVPFVAHSHQYGWVDRTDPTKPKLVPVDHATAVAKKRAGMGPDLTRVDPTADDVDDL